MKKLPWYLNALLWMFAICGGFLLILFIRGCLYAVGILKDTQASGTKTASNLFGLLSSETQNPSTDLTESLYKMLEEYTFFKNGVPKSTQKFPKDYIFTGSVKQFSWGYGIEDTVLSTINHTGGNNSLDFISVKGNGLDAAIPTAKCVKLTDAEVKAYNDSLPKTT